MAPFIVFIIYEKRVSRQQKKIITSANQSHAIVSSLFPTSVRDKLYPTDGEVKQQDSDQEKAKVYQPIAELYPDATVLFAGKCHDGRIVLFSYHRNSHKNLITDIAGFTAWSSGKSRVIAIVPFLKVCIF